VPDIYFVQRAEQANVGVGSVKKSLENAASVVKTQQKFKFLNS